MKRIFLSYTYNPHANFESTTNELVRYTRVVIDSLGIRVDSGEDLGGRAIDSEIQRRIRESDGLVALVTPWADQHGNPAVPPYVTGEYQYAIAEQKPAIRVLHNCLPAQGMYQQNEYIPLDPEKSIEAILKLMRTLAGWKRQSGTPHRVRIEPDDLGQRIQQEGGAQSCEYQLLIDNQPQTEWSEASIWPEPGGIYAYLTQVPEQSKIRVRLTLGDERWESPFSDLDGRIELIRR